MSSPFVVSPISYNDLPQGGQLAPIVIAGRNPSNTVDTQYAAGYFWLSSLNMYQIIAGVPVYGSGNLYYQAGTSAGVPNWIELASIAGNVLSVTGTANQILASPTTGNVVLSLIGPYTPATYTAHGLLIGEGTSSIVATATGSAGQILTSGGASADPTWTTATFPATATAGSLIAATATNVIGQIADVAVGQLLASGGVGVIPAYTGSPSVSGSVTAATGLTATTGNVTASAGNLVSAGSGNGVSLPVTTGSGAASGTVNCNGRTGSVTFTGVSIAAAADLTLTMGNTSIAGASTRVLFSMSGATTGSALSVKSVTPSANQLVWVVTNGTGATTTTSNITFDFIVLN